MNDKYLDAEIDELEKHPEFDPQVKIKDVEVEKPARTPKPVTHTEPAKVEELEGAVGGDGFDGSGFSMFDEPKPENKPKPPAGNIHMYWYWYIYWYWLVSWCVPLIYLNQKQKNKKTRNNSMLVSTLNTDYIM